MDFAAAAVERSIAGLVRGVVCLLDEGDP